MTPVFSNAESKTFKYVYGLLLLTNPADISETT